MKLLIFSVEVINSKRRSIKGGTRSRGTNSRLR